MSAELPPYRIARGRVCDVERVSPNFVRITLEGPEIDDMGTVGQTFDQRIKLVFPPEGGTLPTLADTGDWYAAWLAIPETDRGSMRTYSVRDLTRDNGDDGTGTRLTIDFVLHLAPGLTGPASRWASAAQPGDELLVVGPRQGRTDGGGVEWHPGSARTLLLAGDETAAPAIARILEDSPADASGVAFIEVPDAADKLAISAPAGVAVHWLPRNGAAHGTALLPAVLDHLGATPPAAPEAELRAEDAADAGEDLVWETPLYSGTGEELPSAPRHLDSYFWIAGESTVVTTLRRHLVKDLGIDRAQVAFMGYWRRGVAMRG